MTELEADAWGVRLTRIWNPKQVPRRSQDFLRDEVFSFGGEIAPGVHFGFEIREGGVPYATLYWNKCKMECFRGEIDSYYTPTKKVEAWSVSLAEFAAEWLPLFRRGCWLSGCSIEASAHEKAEWALDFTREEIETWNLKM